MIGVLNKIADKLQKPFRKPKMALNPDLYRPDYSDRHKGRVFLVLGNGPSLSTFKEELFDFMNKRDPIVLGANHITEFIHPHYHAFTNRKRFIKYAHMIDTTKSRALIGPYIPEWIIRERYKGPFEHLMYVNDPEADFDIQDGIIQADCRSVSVQLIGVAIIMGAERIYVAGLDGYQSLISKGSDLHFTRTSTRHSADSQEINVHYYIERQNETARSLRQISDYMEEHRMEPFKIITPTDYAAHYRAITNYL